MKLTKAQQELFDAVKRDGKANVHSSYPPGRKLFELGLVERLELAFGRVRLTIKDPQK